jgi:hypothetical protein
MPWRGALRKPCAVLAPIGGQTPEKSAGNPGHEFYITRITDASRKMIEWHPACERMTDYAAPLLFFAFTSFR